MRVAGFITLVCLTALAGASAPSGVAPRVVYGTYLGGRHKECATAISIDKDGNAYVAGRTPSPDFPVTPGAFSTTTRVNNDDWTGFASKISPHGDRLLYSSFVGGDFYSSANAIKVDAKGRAFVVGSTCSSRFPATASAILAKAPGSDKMEVCDGFVAWFSNDGSHLEYGSYLGGKRSDAATAVALTPDGGVVYVGGYTSSPDFPVAGEAVQRKLSGKTNGFLAAIDAGSGKLLYSTYLGGSGEDRVSAVAVGPTGEVYVAGTTDSREWTSVELAPFGSRRGSDGFVVRLDPSGKLRPIGIRVGGSGEESLAGIDVDFSGDIYVVGTTVSEDFPLRGSGLGSIGSGFAVKISGCEFGARKKGAGVVWSRRVGGQGADALLSVSAKMPGYAFVSGRSGSQDFPSTADAVYRRLESANDTILAQLRAEDGRIEYATFLGGTRQQNTAWYNDEATGVVANASGDVYVAGCTLDDRLPVTAGALQPRRAGNADAFVLRMKFVGGEVTPTARSR